MDSRHGQQASSKVISFPFSFRIEYKKIYLSQLNHGKSKNLVYFLSYFDYSDAWKYNTIESKCATQPASVQNAQELKTFSAAYSLCREICRIPSGRLKQDDLTELFYKYKLATFYVVHKVCSVHNIVMNTCFRVPESQYSLIQSLAFNRTNNPTNCLSLSATPMITSVSYAINVVVSSKYVIFLEVLVPSLNLSMYLYI